MRLSLDPGWLAEAAAALREANLAFARRHPGESAGRQPVHTVYGGAQLFAADAAPKLGGLALQSLERYALTPDELGAALGISDHPALATIHQRLREKLVREPIEDYRIDFEDGYGNRPDAEEDRDAAAVAEAVAQGLRDRTLAPFLGIRIKPLNEELRGRSVRTLDLVLTALARAESLPEHWIVTVPKITVVEQVGFVVTLLAGLEQKLALRQGTLRFEVMVETPQMVLDSRGTSLLPRLLEVSDGRLSGAHFGTYDYTAGVNITAAYQRMRHPACDFAKQVMQAARPP